MPGTGGAVTAVQRVASMGIGITRTGAVRQLFRPIFLNRFCIERGQLRMISRYKNQHDPSAAQHLSPYPIDNPEQLFYLADHILRSRLAY